MARSLIRSGANPVSNIIRSGGFPGIEDIFRELSMAPAFRALEQVPRMRIDVEENDQAYIMKADVPGVRKEDVSVSIDGNMVSIRTDMSEEKSDQKGNTIRSERVFGEEFRSFALPQEVDESKSEAKIENGVLILTLPKKTGTGGRKLQIQ